MCSRIDFVTNKGVLEGEKEGVLEFILTMSDKIKKSLGSLRCLERLLADLTDLGANFV